MNWQGDIGGVGHDDDGDDGSDGKECSMRQFTPNGHLHGADCSQHEGFGSMAMTGGTVGFEDDDDDDNGGPDPVEQHLWMLEGGGEGLCG